jgi:enamine deaminase RidA (YjgF/YER057c/UK114 family)
MTRYLNPPDLPEARGFTHVAVTAPGTTIYLAGQTGHRQDGSIAASLPEQFAQACQNVLTALTAAGASPGDVVSLHIFVTDIEAYRDLRRELGVAYREVFGRHYPPMALFGVAALFDPTAMVELVATAVIA